MQAKAAIGLDVGGTRVKAVVVEDEGTVLDQVVRQSLDNGVKRWAEVAQALVQELIEQYGEELFIGVCAAGLADGNESCIWNLPNRMPGIEGLNWQRFLSRPRAVPALNDGQAALLGERLSSVEFVLNDYVQLRFDGPTLTANTRRLSRSAREPFDGANPVTATPSASASWHTFAPVG